jgi:hypothetical protein
MKTLFTAKKYLPIALALAAVASTGAVPAFAQSASTWSSGISARNARPYVHTPSINDSGYSAYAQVPGTTLRLVPDYFATEPSSLGPVDRFGAGSQR